MVGIKIDLRVNGKPVRIQDEADIRKLRTYLDNLLDWMLLAPEIDNKVRDSLYDERGQATFGEILETENNETETKKRSANPAVGERAIDYIIRALQIKESLPSSIREEPNIDNVYRTVLDLGWKGSDEADKAKRVLVVTARQHKGLVVVNRGRLSLTDAGKQHLKEDDL